MERLRPALEKRRIPDAQRLNALPSGRRVTYVGVVICRQRPQTATGVTFMTLEDETGLVNLVVWRPVFEAHETVAKTAVLLEVRGRIQSEQGVIHLVAEELRDARLPADAEGHPRSRNFH
jgi:error-prone DNA polymerase